MMGVFSVEFVAGKTKLLRENPLHLLNHFAHFLLAFFQSHSVIIPQTFSRSSTRVHIASSLLSHFSMSLSIRAFMSSMSDIRCSASPSLTCSPLSL